MGRWTLKIIFFIILTADFYYSYGCQLEGANWPLPVPASALDTFRGVILNRTTTNIEGIDNVSYGEALNSGPYVDITFANSRVVISTNNAYENYEENETSQSMPITVTFRCTGGSTSIFTFMITVVDTNNNAPRFLPSNEFVFTIAAPVPPGFEVTGCLNDLTVRDIDLTTQRIDFGIADNPYFEIEYDAASSTAAKEFKAILRTTTLIRNIPEPIRLNITATDVDLTGNPALTTSAIVTIIGNADFELPEEPVFSEAYYIATYTEADQLLLTTPIYLRSGYHELVQFTMEGEFSSYFGVISDGRQVSIRVVTPLPGNAFTDTQILLVLKANREQTSGASATIIVQLPAVVPLEFERAHYEGRIDNNNLQVPQLVLRNGYEGASVSVEILSDQSSFFTAVVQGNTITLSMTPLDENIIRENSFIYLQIFASTNSSNATTIVTLEIIKDDDVTPVFNRPIYTGSYNHSSGLTLEPILLVQGYDETVSVSLSGEYSSLFEVSRNSSIVTVRALTIPPETYSQGRIVLSLEATKPRTVGANAAVIITLPAARELKFEASTYRGSLQDNEITIEWIVLTVGYDENIVFSLTGDYANYFSVSNMQNRVTINLIESIPSSIILRNNIVILTLTASGVNAVMTSTTVLLDIIKDDTTTPVFSRNIYYGTYIDTSSIYIGNINLIQGFDDSVTFRIDGDHAQYFAISNTGNNVMLSLRSSIPEDIIFNEKVLLFNVLAEKALTVGANAVVSIRFPSELTEPVVMRFTQNTYTGKIENNLLTTENITLESGYAAGTNFVLTGNYSSYFTITNINNVISLSFFSPLPIEAITSSFLVLEIEARRERAVSVWTSVVIDIINQETTPLVFTEAYYRGVYRTDSGLQFNEDISLLSGYDETTIFHLDGEFASLFTLVQRENNSLSLAVLQTIPFEVLRNNSQLLFVVVASKPNAVPARAAISIDVVTDYSVRNLRFSQDYYTGSIYGSNLTLDEIRLEGYTNDVAYTLTGDYSDYFQLINQDGVFSLQLLAALTDAIVSAHDILIFTLEAQTENTRTHATIILDVIKNRTTDITLTFEETYYVGSYLEDGRLIFNAGIRLSGEVNSSVSYSLEGDQAQWFGLSQTGNTTTLTLTSIIPNIVLQNNQQLIFTIRADIPGQLNSARATIVITILRGDSNYVILGFDEVTYVGSIENNATNITPITVIEGYTDDVTFALYGDLASYFTAMREGSTVNIAIQTPIPALLIPVNRIIVLEIIASAPRAVTAYATIVFEVVVEDDVTSPVQLMFDAPYYIGSYNASHGLLLQSPIILSEGYNDNVRFGLQGVSSQWFTIASTQNTVTLIMSSAIPDAVLANSSQLVFVITAQRPGATPANATIVITLTRSEVIDGPVLGFDRVTYLGTIQNSETQISPIRVIEGYTSDVTFGLYGDLASYFTVMREGSTVNITIQTPIPALLIPANRIIVLEIRASVPRAVTAYATIVFEVVVEDDVTSPVQLMFNAPYYTGSYNASHGLLLQSPIILSEGYDDNVRFGLQGVNSQWFTIASTQNTVTLIMSSAIPDAVLANSSQLVFVISAQRPGATPANATIVITLTRSEVIDGPVLGFDRVTYLGTIQNSETQISPIRVIEGYTSDVRFGLYGDLASYFTVMREGSTVNITIQTPIPALLIPANRIIVLEIRASVPRAVTAYATIVFEVVVEDDVTSPVQLMFNAPYYTGSYNASHGLLLQSPIILSEGYDDNVRFGLQGVNSQWFTIASTQNTVTLIMSSAIPDAVLANSSQLVFVISAQRPGATPANATIVITLTRSEVIDGPVLGFDRVTYLGTIQNNETQISPIRVIEGYTSDVTFGLYGDLASYFTVMREGSIVNIAIQTPIPALLIPANHIIVLEIRASAPRAVTAYATIVFEVVVEDDVTSRVQLMFDAPYYIGSYNASHGLLLESPIILSEGYDDNVRFGLQGENSQWFNVMAVQNSVTLVVSSAIPDAVLSNNRQFVFLISARRPGANIAQATIIISLYNDLQTGDDVSFERVLYQGIIQLNEIQHELIVISGYNGTNVDIRGEYGSLFVAYVLDGVVSVQASGSLTLPSNVTRLALELHAAGARAVLLLNVVQSGVPVLPSVTFSSSSYMVTVEIVQTGLVGRVSATADNGEAITYSLATDNGVASTLDTATGDCGQLEKDKLFYDFKAHLQTRLSINNAGELHLSAPANSGVYTFQVIASTVITQATGTATVHLTSVAVTVCGEDEFVLPPLIILDRDEEEPHNNLVVLNSTQHVGCYFNLANRWPGNQTWLYVDENGLHTRAIDREHPSIAFMALSQVQVELTLYCDTDNVIRTKRSERTDPIDPYDYGANKWILTDTIPYNSRRSLVNLIVNDINDNYPIFVGKEREPIAVGYPIDELEERILPRSLAELKATDADIGENAALIYWSSESELAVSPTTGAVHVRGGARLRHDRSLTVSATDRRGEGLTGTIQLVVKLLHLNNIAVVTVRDAFLDDETTVLAVLGDAVGYEVKTLRSVVISDGTDEDVTRKKRETNILGTSLQLYVYGLIDREPVAVTRLVADINNNAANVSVISTIPLEDHLEDNVIADLERDVGLLVATIVLAILLFILILLIAIWFFLRWRKGRTFDELTDVNSLISRNESVSELPKPEAIKPKLNIEDLKRSERRLQDRLNVPVVVEDANVEPTTSKEETFLESVLNLPMPEPHAPIVIQSIDKLKDADETEDDFGENNTSRRKSVVTFNENVEKIIHVEDDTDMDGSSESGYEIYHL